MKQGTFDAAVMSAESGSVLTLLYPKYTVVVPEPRSSKFPLRILWLGATKTGCHSSIPGSS